MASGGSSKGGGGRAHGANRGRRGWDGMGWISARIQFRGGGGRRRALLLYKCKFLLGMEKEAEKDKQISEEEEEEEYVLLELDDVHYSCIQPNAPCILSALDTSTPTLVVGEGLKMIGEYEETVGTCYLYSESDAPAKPVHEEPAPPKENKDKQGRNIKEAPSKEVKHIASVHKILKFRSTSKGHQEHRAYRYRDKEF